MKKIICILLFVPAFVMAQSTEQNYVKTKAYKVETATTIAVPTATQAVQTVTYMDGLGRPIQQINYLQSNTGKDIIKPIEYDAFGRQEKNYLPYVSSASSLNYDSNALVNVTAFYSNATSSATGNPNFEATSNPYNKTRFEASPLSRVLEQASVGNDWEMSLQHTNKIDYQFNTTADNVKIFKAVTTLNNNVYTLPTLPTDLGYYAPNKLYKTVIKNENWVATDGNNNITHEFKNNEGQVVLKRAFGVSQVNNFPFNTAHDSYYIYDQFGNLTYIIPPLVDVTTPLTQTILDNLCYQYVYDNHNRLAEKKLPGKAWEFIVYDMLNRVVATGPAFAPFADFINLNKTGWLITKYDVLNRVVCSGWLESMVAITSAERTAKQTVQNGLTTTLNESKQTTGTIDGIVAFYSNAVAPTAYKLLTVNYYDDYTFPNAPAGTFPTTVLNDVSQNVFYNNSTQKPIGMGTASWIRTLQTSALINGETSYVLYDNKARAIRNYKKNFLGGYTQVDSKVDFAGKVLYTETKHKRIATDAEIYVREDYTYTDQDRLAMHTHKIGIAGTPEVLSKNTYDELGQLISKKVGGTDTSGITYFQKVDYNYNSRGWLKGINNINNLTQGTDPQDLFAFKINYNTTEGAINYNGKSLYNGNISETYWRSKSDDIKRKYGYLYDNLNRLRLAIYHKPDLAVGVTNCYNENIMYDKNGNILRMQRNGDLDVQDLAAQIDNLDYTYLPNSNRLSLVKDNSANSLGFKDDVASGVADTVADYDYDNNGNMKLDTNKAITKIVYNYLNLPVEISFANLNTKISYTYNSVGQKLQKIVKAGALPTQTKTIDYQDSFQYRNNVLLFFPTSEGYVNNVFGNGINNYNYVYNYVDHLGNVQMNYAKNPTDNTLSILEESHYYPFGLKHTNYNANLNAFANRIASTSTGGIVLKGVPSGGGPVAVIDLPYQYKYNGKEHQDELGLNVTAMDFRQYDGAIGRFTSMDALSEMDSDKSPFAFVRNSPIMYNDPSGLSAESEYNTNDEIDQNLYLDHAPGVFGQTVAQSDMTSGTAEGGGELREATVTNSYTEGFDRFGILEGIRDSFDVSDNYRNYTPSGAYGPYIPDAIGVNLTVSVNTGIFGNFGVNIGGTVDVHNNAEGFVGGYMDIGYNGSLGIPKISFGASIDFHDSYIGNNGSVPANSISGGVLGNLVGVNQTYNGGLGLMGGYSYSLDKYGNKAYQGVETKSVGLGLGINAQAGKSKSWTFSEIFK